MPEGAFVGRSNVGKSSLINSLVGRVCARVSKTPGRTQQINFFSVNNKISLVDLPGYGYAAVSKQMRIQWDNLILDYLRYRKNLKRIFLLIDSRFGIKNNDEEIIEIFDQLGLSYQIVLTKIDKINENQLSNLIENIEKNLESHPAAFPRILSTSSKNFLGIKEISFHIMDVL